MRDMMELNAIVTGMEDERVQQVFGTEKADVELLVRHFAKNQLNGDNGIDPLKLYSEVLDTKAEELKKDYEVKKESLVNFVRTMVKEQFLAEEEVKLFTDKKKSGGADTEKRRDYSKAYTAWKRGVDKAAEEKGEALTEEEEKEIKETAFVEYNAKWKS